MKRCRNCLLPNIVPNASLDAAHLCAFCRRKAAGNGISSEGQRLRFKADLEETLEGCRGKGPYDCVVSLSGGKDSLYLLYKLKVEYRMKVLAFTCDLDIPAIGWENIRRTVNKLNVAHVVFRPAMDFYKAFFRYLLKNQSADGAVRSVCYISAPLTEGFALQLATERRIPLILTGYSPGQPDPDWMLYEMAREKICKSDWTPDILRTCGRFSEEALSCFWNPNRYPTGTSFPRFLAPFHAWSYDQDEVMTKVSEWGLVRSRRFANPVLTNSPFQWLLMYSDLKHFGYNPYAPEFCALIRNGQASRKLWRVLFPMVDFMIRNRVLLGRPPSGWICA